MEKQPPVSLLHQDPREVLLVSTGWSPRHSIGAVLIIVAVYLATLSPHWWIGPDAGLYLNLARNVSSGDGYTIAGKTHTHVPPGYPMLLAAMMSLGLGDFLFLNVLMLATGLAAVTASFWMLRQLVHPVWAFVIGMLVALSHQTIQRSGEILSDIPFMLLVLAAIAMYYRGLREGGSRRLWETASILLVACCWFRIVGFAIAAGAALGLLLSAWRPARRRAILNFGMVLIGCGVSLAYFYWYQKVHADPLVANYAGSIRHLAGEGGIVHLLARPFVNIYLSSGDFCRLFIVQEMHPAASLLLVVLPILGGMFLRMRRKDFLGPMAVLVYVALLSSVLIRTRYLLAVLPLLLLFMIEGYAGAMAMIVKRTRAKPTLTPAAIMGILGLIFAFNITLVARHAYHKHADWRLQQKGKFVDEIAAAEFLRSREDRGAILAGAYVGYLADRPCPTVPYKVMNVGLSRQQLIDFLNGWGVRTVVLNESEELKPFYQRAKELVEESGHMIWRQGSVSVYALDVSAEPSHRTD